jgi:hypothetical protein
MTRIRLAATALLSLIASTAWADLRTYDIPQQHQQEIYNALARVLNPEGQPTQGRVQLLPSGQLLVNAAPETLEQVEAVLQTIRARPAEAAPRAELRYWAVLGSATAPANTPGQRPPNELRDVLAELERLHGDLEFRVLGTAALTTESGQSGFVDGLPLDVEQDAFVQGETLTAQIAMNLEGGALLPVSHVGKLSLRTSIRRGEFVVLGASEVRGFDNLDGLVFYIVHWPEQ